MFEAFLQLLAETSKTARVVQFFDSTVMRAHGLGGRGGPDRRGQLAAAVGGCESKNNGSFAVKYSLLGCVDGIPGMHF